MSLQLEQYLAARSDGAPVEIAADMAGFSLTEARLTETAVAKGEIEQPRARAHTRKAQSTKEGSVARDSETTVQIGNGPKIPVSDFVKVAERTNVAADQLRLFIERIERLSEERKGIADDIADVYGEAKANGYDKPTMRRIVKLRAMDSHARQEAAALLETYANAVGLQDALPL